MPQGYPPPQKQGMSTLAKVLLVFGVLAMLGIGTCAAGAFWLKGKATEVAESLADGGGGSIVLVSPPEVKAALAGPKAAYVGAWRGTGTNALDIGADGMMRFVKGEGRSDSTMNAPIAAFRGNDIEMKAFITVTMKVSEAPHQVGDHWEMTVDNIKLQRK